MEGYSKLSCCLNIAQYFISLYDFFWRNLLCFQGVTTNLTKVVLTYMKFLYTALLLKLLKMKELHELDISSYLDVGTLQLFHSELIKYPDVVALSNNLRELLIPTSILFCATRKQDKPSFRSIRRFQYFPLQKF